MGEEIIPSPPALEIAAAKSALVIHIMVPPIIGYLMSNIFVISV